jgi:hypothetical protein
LQRLRHLLRQRVPVVVFAAAPVAPFHEPAFVDFIPDTPEDPPRYLLV